MSDNEFSQKFNKIDQQSKQGSGRVKMPKPFVSNSGTSISNQFKIGHHKQSTINHS